ncbi:MAG: DUF2071 domain-containing protein [Armatimonadetes bacterium]|nr:DUF2071 domain-containing protein [Armatimonadota bacterium]
MRQNWHDLTFLHWSVDPDVVQRLLPQGLEADLFDGRAYVSLVPFTMTGVTPLWLRPRSVFADFHETNLRTYVRREGREPGVWFFSLEASKRLPVVVARNRYRLPYHFARMELHRSGGYRLYRTVRVWPGPPSGLTEVEASFVEVFRTAEPDTLEFWLLERYLLYSMVRGRFWTGRVHHAPYPFCTAEATVRNETLTAAAGFPGLGPPNVAAQFSPGVSVEVFPLRPC